MRASKNITLGLVAVPLLMIGAVGAAIAQTTNAPDYTYTKAMSLLIVGHGACLTLQVR
jgi:hypothetical protein